MSQKIYTALFDYRLPSLPSGAEVNEHVCEPLSKALRNVEDDSASEAYELIGGGFFALLRLYKRETPKDCDLMTLMIESRKPIDLGEDGLELGNLSRVLSEGLISNERDLQFIGCLKRCRQDSTYYKSSGNSQKSIFPHSHRPYAKKSFETLLT
ncbi:Spermine synthase [Caligus rogercresseyi]|uniref:Spermine synthase n=1 Tax=Caligus rogercresseyi TaxID=217165 RepID=A0A7T8HI43_CALRO|nr:Spermine synthase [Caligus rogercresseyi]